MIRYRECQRNHAAHLGGHVTDGCCEFMPAGNDDGTPLSLKCAACDCHRNFHRKEPEVVDPTTTTTTTTAPPPPANNGYISFGTPKHELLPNVVGPQQRRPAPGVMVGFGGGVGAESSSEELNTGGGSSKKRFRTKFSEEQKDKMMEFAEKIGWRMQKQNENEVLRFCNEVGVSRRVFKVWLHNNKQALKRKQTSS